MGKKLDPCVKLVIQEMADEFGVDPFDVINVGLVLGLKKLLRTGDPVEIKCMLLESQVARLGKWKEGGGALRN